MMHILPSYAIFFSWVPCVPANEDPWFLAYMNYRQNRENGDKIDNPKRPFPKITGRYYWEEDKSLRNTHDYKYWNRAHYDPSYDDEEYMREKDQNYLARIEAEGKLKELEPAIWYLREKEQATNMNIKIWWANKLKNPKLSTLLKWAEQVMKEGILVFLEGRNERLGVNSLVKILPNEILLKISELAHGKKILAANFFKKNLPDIVPTISANLKPHCKCYESSICVTNFTSQSDANVFVNSTIPSTFAKKVLSTFK